MKTLLFIMMCAIAWPANADEPWMYPVPFEIPRSRDEWDSMRMLVHSVEAHGTRYAENTSRIVPESVASFDDIVKWYSERLKVSDLTEELSEFNARDADDPGMSAEGLTWPKDNPKKPVRTLVTHWFTTNQKQITFLLPEESGSIVAVSLLGVKGKTKIQVMRRRTEEIADNHTMHMGDGIQRLQFVGRPVVPGDDCPYPR